MRDLPYALRRLWGSPWFTVGATLTLAIAIGATASVFGLVDGILLKPFPYSDSERVFVLVESEPASHVPQISVSPANFLDWRAQSHAFTTLAAASYRQVTVSDRDRDAERLNALAVTPNYFPTLGIATVVGRGLALDSSGPQEAVISYAYWQRRFAGNASSLGQSVTLDGQPFTVVGVMPSGVIGAPSAPSLAIDVWTRLSFTRADETNRGFRFLDVYGRLAPGATATSAQHEMETIAQRLAVAFPEEDGGHTIFTALLADDVLGPVRPALIMLLSAAACVLLIGAANLANLFLVRYLGRQRELAIRVAMGATQRHLAKELILEAAIIGVAAGTVGIAVAVVGVDVLRIFSPQTLPRLGQVGMSMRIVAVCLGAAVVTVVLFGVLPAVQVSRANLLTFMKDGARRMASRQHHRAQNGLVSLQVAMALVLLTGAELLVASFQHLRHLELGFRPEGVLTASIALPPTRYATPEQQDAFTASVADRLAVLPGVDGASASTATPGSPGTLALSFEIVGDPPANPNHLPTAFVVCGSHRYFHTMGIALRHGRGVLPSDTRRSVEIAVVDALFVREYFPGRDPIGRRLNFGADTATIVGVVDHVRQAGLTAIDLPGVYAPLVQCPSASAYVAIHTTRDPETLATALKHTIATLDPTVPVSDIKTEQTRMARSIATTRFASWLASLFALVAGALGVVGIYSVLIYIVSQQTREIAIRIALGARARDVITQVLRRALMLTCTGVIAGSFGAWIFSRSLASLLVGVSPHDPRAFTAAAGGFAIVALLASSIPAWRTTRINPVEALTATM